MSEDNKTLDRIIDKVEDIQRDVYQVRVDMAEHKLLFEANASRDQAMHDSLTKVEEHLDRFDSHLSEYNRQLEIHIAGVRALDEANKLDREKFELYKEETKKDLETLKTPQIVIKGILWVAGVIITIGAAVGSFKLLLP